MRSVLCAHVWHDTARSKQHGRYFTRLDPKWFVDFYIPHFFFVRRTYSFLILALVGSVHSSACTSVCHDDCLCLINYLLIIEISVIFVVVSLWLRCTRRKLLEETNSVQHAIAMSFALTEREREIKIDR